MTVSMLWRHCLPCFIWLLVWKTCSAGNSEEYLLKGFHGDLTALAEKLKYVRPLARNGDESEASTEAFLGLENHCPFFAELGNKLKELKKEREEAINTSLNAIRDIVSPEKLACENITEVRDEVLEKLNASLTCEAPPMCDESLPYRQPDGSCNNIKNPEWGKVDTCFRRILSPAYADGVSKPRVSCNSSELPNARLISITLHNEVNKTHENLTHLAMIFGQFLTHDITFVSFAPLSSIEFELGAGPFDLCEDNDTACIAIQVPENDTFYSQFNITRLPMMRSLTCSDCKLGYKEQVNSRTTYMDLSQVYGIKADILATLRKFEKGLLISQEAECVEYPPDSPFPYLDNCSLPNKNMKCHWTGDLRAPQHIALISTQTLWLREHNRIAKKLSSLYPHWDDERLFQTARRIVEARYQHIVFSEYLPKMIGEENMRNFSLTPLKEGFTKYDETVNPTLPNEFSAAAFRFGHPQANKNFWRISENGDWLEPLNLSTGYFIPHNNTDANHNSVLRGSVKQLSQEFNRHGDVSVRGNLFRLAEFQYGFDLFAIDIQRGREHGLRPYVDYVKHCRNITVHDFKELKDLMAEDNVIDIFQNLYTNVRDIDLYSGGLSEKPIEGGQMGETFACIVAEAFKRLKFGDRFYYEHENQSGSFTQEQLNSIRNTTLASVFCNNIQGLSSIQRDVFLKVSNESNPLVNCSEVQDIDLSKWDDTLTSAPKDRTTAAASDVSHT